MNLINSPAKNIRRVEDHRLAYYGAAADAFYWDQHWRKVTSCQMYNDIKSEIPAWLDDAVNRFLPRKGLILEAGCGLGQYVNALLSRGYEIEGVEWGSETVNTVREKHPDLPIRHGDVTRLEVSDNYYQGYISLGVVEHRKQGPEPFLVEAYRILNAGGVALISVPYFNSLRQLKARLRLYRRQKNGMKFYQYAFSENEFADFLRLAGFNIITKLYYDVVKGLEDELPLLKWIFQLRGIGWRLKKFFILSKWINRYAAHMMMFIGEKPETKNNRF